MGSSRPDAKYLGLIERLNVSKSIGCYFVSSFTVISAEQDSFFTLKV